MRAGSNMGWEQVCGERGYGLRGRDARRVGSGLRRGRHIHNSTDHSAVAAGRSARRDDVDPGGRLHDGLSVRRRRGQRASAASGSRRRVCHGLDRGNGERVRGLRERGEVHANLHRSDMQLAPGRPGESPRELRRLGPGDCVLCVGGQALAHRRGVGVRGAGHGRSRVPVGQRRAVVAAVLAQERRKRSGGPDLRGGLVPRRRLAVRSSRHGGER